jgi:hypothetical protein
LPTTGDMHRYFISQEINEVCLEDLQGYLKKFPAVDDEYKILVLKLWQQGILFQDTNFVPVNDELGLRYVFRKNIDLQVKEVMTCD